MTTRTLEQAEVIIADQARQLKESAAGFARIQSFLMTTAMKVPRGDSIDQWVVNALLRKMQLIEAIKIQSRRTILGLSNAHVLKTTIINIQKMIDADERG